MILERLTETLIYLTIYIDHDILLNKLHFYGIRGIAHKWFNSYLSHRKQYVKYREARSELMNVTCGVPQGSVLRPLLFIIYTNDLAKCINHSNAILFADDTTVYVISADKMRLYSYMNDDLHTLNDWFKANKLSLNVNKTVCMFFSNNIKPNKETCKVKIGDSEIKEVDHFKFLGLIIDSNLKWQNHIEHCKAKISSSLYIMNQVQNVLPIKQLLILYTTLIQPYLEYGIVLWGGTYQTYIRKLIILQKKCIRCVNGSKYNEHTYPIFRDLNILPVNDIYKYHLGKFMFSYYRNELPTRLNHLFVLNSSYHDYNTRHSGDPHLPRYRLMEAQNSLIYQATKLWYEIPVSIKDSGSKRIFNKRLKKRLIDN